MNGQPTCKKESQSVCLWCRVVLDRVVNRTFTQAMQQEHGHAYRDVVIVGDEIKRFQRYHDFEFNDFIMTWNSNISLTIS